MRSSTIVFCLTLLALGCGRSATPAATSGASTAPAAQAQGGDQPYERPSGQSVLAKGASHRVELNAGESHEWGIDLAAGEQVTLSIEASSTGATMCQGWMWGFYNPSGGALREQPMGPEESGAWRSDMDQVAEASIVEGPTAGRYLVRVSSDASCPQLHYTLSAR